MNKRSQSPFVINSISPRVAEFQMYFPVPSSPVFSEIQVGGFLPAYLLPIPETLQPKNPETLGEVSRDHRYKEKPTITISLSPPSHTHTRPVYTHTHTQFHSLYPVLCTATSFPETTWDPEQTRSRTRSKSRGNHLPTSYVCFLPMNEPLSAERNEIHIFHLALLMSSLIRSRWTDGLVWGWSSGGDLH